MGKLEEFLLELETELQYLKPKDASEVLKYYRDRINIALDYGETIEHILAKLPTPQKIAAETYKSKGTDFLNIRKKQLRKKQIVNAIFSSILLFIMIVAFFAISFFLITSIVRLFNLVIASFQMNTWIDKITLFFLVVSYIFIIIIAMIYIFDLFYIIGMHFLQYVLDALNKQEKEYKFMDFTISGSLENTFKKKKILGKILLGFTLSIVLFGVTSYTTKGYLYRSMNNLIETNKSVDIAGQIHKITLNESEVFLKVSSSDEIIQVKLNYGFEFDHTLNYEVIDGNLIIDSITTNKYDIFGLLDEPLPIIEIVIPTSMAVSDFDLTFNNGILDFAYLTKGIDLKISGSNSTIALTKNTIHHLQIDGYNLNINNEENQMDICNLDIEEGRYCAVKDEYNTIKINNHLATLILQEVRAEVADITCRSTKTALDKIQITNLTYTDLNSESYLRDVFLTKAVICSEGSSKISLERIVATEEIEFKTVSGTIDTKYLKSPSIIGDFNRGSINFLNIGQNTITQDETNAYLVKYNAYNIDINTTIYANNAETTISNTKIVNFDGEIEKGKLAITSSYFKNSSIKETSATLDFADLDGETMKVNVDGGNFYYYNDNITSNIILTIEGQTLKTNISVDDEIKRGE